jgi:uncharacterized protein YjbI with pentapeptide repeats
MPMLPFPAALTRACDAVSGAADLGAADLGAADLGAADLGAANLGAAIYGAGFGEQRPP